MRIGQGYDVHKLVKNRKLILGGVNIPHKLGLDGHSDADVLVHAIMDALLGATALGDIGKLFPDTDDIFKNIDSMILLEKIFNILDENGYYINNIDCTIIAQEPKLLPYIDKMRENIANTLKCSVNDISIKATTEEKLGFTGREEGISCHCVALINKK